MISELLELSRQLKEAGIPVPMQHADVGKTKKGKKLVVLIGQDGRPVYYYLAQGGTFFRHARRNAHSFPVIRIQKPMCASDQVPENINETAALSQPFALNSDSKDIVISPWTKKQLEPLCEGNKELCNLRALIERFPDEEKETQRFNRHLVDLIQESIAYRPELHSIVYDIFFGEKAKNPGRTLGKPSTQIVFDIVDADPDAFSIQQPELWNTLIRLLRERDQREEERESPAARGISYLSGQSVVFERIKTQDPTLPVLGSAFVYTRDKSVKYLKRFGLNGLDFHMGKQELNEAVDALAYLVQDEFKGRTWKELPGQKASPDLLIAYVEQKPQDGLAELLGGSQEFYAEVVNRVVEQFRDRAETHEDRLPIKTPKYTIRLLVLGKIDDARKQVLLNRQYDMEQVIGCAQNWQRHFQAGLKIDLTGRTFDTEPVYPADLAELSQIVWGIENGRPKKVKQIPSIKLGDLYDLYIPSKAMCGYEELCHKLLDRFVMQGWPLIGCIGHENCRGELKSDREKDKFLSRCVRDFISIYTMLLDKLQERAKEDGMSVAFLLGQFLKAVDILHKEYCSANSPNNRLPPRLLGNAHYQIAFDRPLTAIEMVSQRLPIYLAWADTAQEATPMAQQIKEQLEDLMGRELFSEEAFAAWGSAQRAQLMQGYLAKLPCANQAELTLKVKKEAHL